MRGVSNRTVLRQIQTLFSAGTATGLTDGQLLERFVSRSDTATAEAAFAALVHRHGPMVLAACRSLVHDPQDAEDAFQAVFLVLARKARSVRVDGSLGGWLYGVAHRIALRSRGRDQRRRAFRRDDPGSDFDVASDATGPPAAAERAELRRILHDELGRLPDKYRTPVVLCYLEGLTHEEAAARLRWPVGSVKGRMARARDVLRRRLIHRGVTFPAGGLAVAVGRDATAALMSPALVQNTVQAAMASLGALGGASAVAGLASTAAISLAEGATRSMLMLKLKFAAAGLVALGTAGGGVGAYVRDGGTPVSEASTIAASVTAEDRPVASDSLADALDLARERLTKLVAEKDAVLDDVKRREAIIREGDLATAVEAAEMNLNYVTEMLKKVTLALEDIEFEKLAPGERTDDHEEWQQRLRDSSNRFRGERDRLRDELARLKDRQRVEGTGASSTKDHQAILDEYRARRERLERIELEILNAQKTIAALEQERLRRRVGTPKSERVYSDPNTVVVDLPWKQSVVHHLTHLAAEGHLSDPEALALSRRIAQLKSRLEQLRRTTPHPNDPPLVAARLEYERLNTQAHELWSQRLAAIEKQAESLPEPLKSNAAPPAAELARSIDERLARQGWPEDPESDRAAREFHRRTMLERYGRLPTLEEQDQFLEHRNPVARRRLTQLATILDAWEKARASERGGDQPESVPEAQGLSGIETFPEDTPATELGTADGAVTLDPVEPKRTSTSPDSFLEKSLESVQTRLQSCFREMMELEARMKTINARHPRLREVIEKLNELARDETLDPTVAKDVRDQASQADQALTELSQQLYGLQMDLERLGKQIVEYRQVHAALTGDPKLTDEAIRKIYESQFHPTSRYVEQQGAVTRYRVVSPRYERSPNIEALLQDWEAERETTTPVEAAEPAPTQDDEDDDASHPPQP